MGSYYCYFVYVLQVYLLLFVSIAVSSSSPSSSQIFMSGDVLKEQRYTGRNLLQKVRNCPVAVNMQFANYTILTSKCKGPVYPADKCCAALGDFACPFSKYINDVSYDCSAVMFTYIDQQTHYPRGLFASECRKDIPCPGDSPSSSSPVDADASAAVDALFLIPQSLIFVFTLLILWLPFLST